MDPKFISRNRLAGSSCAALFAAVAVTLAAQQTAVAGPAIDITKLTTISTHATPGPNPLDLGGVEAVKIVRTNTFGVAAGYTLDIFNNAVIINNVGLLSNIGSPTFVTPGNPYDASVDNGGGDGLYNGISGLIQNGLYDGPGTSPTGLWDGQGITSTTAANDPNFFFQVGSASNLDLGLVDWVSAPSAVHPVGFTWATALVPDAILMKMTYFGDANLDGFVDANDYVLIDIGFGAAGALTGWVYGDFNYDGLIDGNDYVVMDIIAGIPHDPALVGGGSGAPMVPEPGSLGLAMVGALGLLGRRRRAQSESK